MPVWIRLPKQGVNEFFTGMKRDQISTLCSPGKDGSPPKVRSKICRKPGAKRHIRLIHLGSLLKYVEALPEELEPGGADA